MLLHTCTITTRDKKTVHSEYHKFMAIAFEQIHINVVKKSQTLNSTNYLVMFSQFSNKKTSQITCRSTDAVRYFHMNARTFSYFPHFSATASPSANVLLITHLALN